MTTQYTPILKLALPVTGELSGTWGDVVNNNITSMVEQAIAGLSTINTWTTNSHTLTTANGTTSEARCAMLVADDDGAGNPSAAATIICPAAAKLYVLKNISGQAVTLKTSGGTGVSVPNNDTAFLFCDGTNVEACVTTVVNGHISGNLTVDGNTTLGDAAGDTVTINAGTTTVTQGTANTVLYLNASKVISGTVGFTWDGSTLAVPGAISATVSANTAHNITATNTSTGTSGQTNLYLIQNDTTARIASYGSTHGTRASTAWLITSEASRPIVIAPSNAEVGRFSSTGLTVTGSFSATGSTTVPAVSVGGSPYVGWNNANFQTIDFAGNASGGASLIYNISSTNAALWNNIYNDGTSSKYKVTGSASQIGGTPSSATMSVYASGTAGTALGTAASAFTVTTTGATQAVSGTTITSVTSTGLAVTGTLSATGLISSSLSANGAVSNIFTSNNTGTGAGVGSAFKLQNNGTDVAKMQWSYNGSAFTTDVLGYGGITITPGNNAGSNTTVGTFSTTGLAVTGTLSATGATSVNYAGARLTIQSSDATAAALILRDSGTTNALAIGSSGQDMYFQSGGLERMRLDQNGNFGVGVTANASSGRLDVIQNGTSAINVRASGSGAGQTVPVLRVTDSGNGTWATAQYWAQAHQWGASGTGTAMTLSSSGNLGIGVSPSAWSGITAIEFGGSSFYGSNGGTGAWSGTNTYYNGTNWILKNTAAATLYIQTNAGNHVWQTAASGTSGATAVFSDKMTLDASGNLGLGVTPSASWSGQKAIQVGSGGSVSYGNGMALSNNAIHTSAGFASNYIATGAAALYLQGSGTHTWYTAPSGTAGNAITWSTSMTLDASGNLALSTSQNAQTKITVSNANAGANASATAQFTNDAGTYELSAYSNASGFSGDMLLNIVNGKGFQVLHVGSQVARFSSAGLAITGGSLGYGTGAGGTVTQATSRTTGVTLNKPSGAITLFTAAGSATAASFTVTNSVVAATDTIVLSVKSGTNKYLTFVTAVAAGSFEITFQTTGGTASDAPVINFAVIKGVTA